MAHVKNKCEAAEYVLNSQICFFLAQVLNMSYKFPMREL